MIRIPQMILLSMFVLISVGHADEVYLKNGDRLTGRIVSMSEGVMQFESDMVGSVSMKTDTISRFSSSESHTVEFNNGQQVQEPIHLSGRDAMVLAGKAVSLEDIAAINPPVAVKSSEWSGDITGDFAAQRGNSEKDAANLRLQAKRSRDDEVLNIKGEYLFSSQKRSATGNDETTDDRWKIGAKNKWLLSDRWYTFAQASYERDRISELDRRIIGGFGAGYMLKKSETFNFTLEAGLALIHEKYSDPSSGSSDEISLQAGYEMDKKLNDKMLFVHSFTYFPSFGDLADYLINTDAELRLHMTENLFTSLRAEIEYDATPARNSENLDERYILGLGYSF